ncbi:hypothetical protein EON65_59250 [archaeon]|nr:MAG: hypothetical protein EON65_59250 [archaeon]
MLKQPPFYSDSVLSIGAVCNRMFSQGGPATIVTPAGNFCSAACSAQGERGAGSVACLSYMNMHNMLDTQTFVRTNKFVVC